MRKNAWIFLLILICVAFLVSCGKKNTEETEMGELVRTEAWEENPRASVFWREREGMGGNPSHISPLKSLTDAAMIDII